MRKLIVCALAGALGLATPAFMPQSAYAQEAAPPQKQGADDLFGLPPALVIAGMAAAIFGLVAIIGEEHHHHQVSP